MRVQRKQYRTNHILPLQASLGVPMGLSRVSFGYSPDIHKAASHVARVCRGLNRTFERKRTGGVPRVSMWYPWDIEILTGFIGVPAAKSCPAQPSHDVVQPFRIGMVKVLVHAK